MRAPPRFNDGPLRGVYTRFAPEPPPVAAAFAVPLAAPAATGVPDGVLDLGKTDVLCYDTETSDADTRHAQIFQFACVRADPDLTPRQDFEVRIRRLPYVVPSPEALAVTGLSLADIESADRVPEYEGARRIADILDLPHGVTSRLLLTFNGHGFDDPLIGTVLERNLLSADFCRHPKTLGETRPRRDEAALQVFRIDVLCLARLAVAIEPGAIRTRPNDKGVPDMRLEALCRANDIPIRAHDACGDARATLALARLLKERAPAAWRIARRCSGADGVIRALGAARDAGEVAWLFRSFGTAEAKPCWVARVERGRAALVPLDRLDVPLPEDPDAPIAYCQDPHILAVKPHMAPYLLTGDEARAIAPASEFEAIPARRAALAGGRYDGRIAEILRRLDAAPYREAPDATSEERHEWASSADSLRKVKFLKAGSWSERAAIRFDSARLRDFAARLVAMHCTDRDLARAVPPDRVAEIAADAAAAFARPTRSGNWMNLEAALAHPSADAGYRAWAERAFPRGAPPSPEPAEEQPSLAF